MNFPVFISCSKGLVSILEKELKTLGFVTQERTLLGVSGEASLATIYQICIWSRIANRVLVTLFSGQVAQPETIQNLCYHFPWQTVFSAEKTFSVVFHGTSKYIRNTMYGAQVVKDGIADYFRKFQNQRPHVSKVTPDISLHAYLSQDKLTVSLDMTGYSLHQRGYRLDSGAAPLKENVAAALLMQANWPEYAQKGYGLQDPFCGSGTIVIEAALMAANIAPGLLRNDQALIHWVQHQPTLWEKLRTQALALVTPYQGALCGSDSDARILIKAKQNAERAGVQKLITWKHLDMSDSTPLAKQGLLICNPPYGERLEEIKTLIPLYQKLGAVLYQNYRGWEAAVLTSEVMLAKAIGLRSHQQHTFFNGAIECKLYHFSLNASNRLKGEDTGGLSESAQMFANRLQKNWAHLKKWAKLKNIQAYRVYDADLPNYAYAIDIYADYVVLQEYKAPTSIPQHKIIQHNLDAFQVIPKILGIDPKKLVIKQRQRQKGLAQYEKIDQKKQYIEIIEGTARFYVNLQDYLDTGLFLDHRPLRLSFATMPALRHAKFLNLFCYTATVSVHAALNQAYTTNVDLSRTYLAWAEQNFKLNHLALNQHQFIQADVLVWLKQSRDKFDVIFLDPPSFSNSKRMNGVLDIQKDHVNLIDHAMQLLVAHGILYFSTNLRSFQLDEVLSTRYKISDITFQTIDQDFKRQPKIHRVFTIQHQ